MIESLDPCLRGALAPWRDLVALDRGDEPVATDDDATATPVSAASLLDPSVAADLIARFALKHGDADRRAVVSMWTQWYFGTLAVPSTAALLVLGRALPIALAEARMVFGADGCPTRLVLGHDGSEAASAISPSIAELVEQHAAPLIDRLAAQFRVSPRLLWCNLGTILDWVLREVGEDARADQRDELRQRLSDPVCGGRRNPLCGAVEACAEAGGCLRRRVCCLRYKLPGVPSCGSLCPLPEISGAAQAN